MDVRRPEDAARRSCARSKTSARSAEPRLLDLTPIADLDDTGALWLARAMRGVVQLEASVQQREILDRVSRGAKVQIAMERRIDPYAPAVKVGNAALLFGVHLRDATALLGQLVLETAALARRPRDAPLRELSASVFRAGVAALPVTMLVGFLVGIVLTYLSALQLKRYGADLLVINIVGVGVVRELGPMLASIIAAGRSGSAMTAQLGVMRVTEEIEALQVMGVSVITRLVLPKVVALAIALPLVTFCTDLAALAGAMVVSRFALGIPPQAFLKRFRAPSRRSTSGSASARLQRTGSRLRSSHATTACACCRTPTASPPASQAQWWRPSCA